MKWTSMTSDGEIPSLNTPVVVLDSPRSEFARAMFGASKKRKLDEVPEYSASESAFVADTSRVVEAMIPSSSSQSSHVPNFISSKRKKKETWSLQMQRAIIADDDGDRAIHIAVAQENVTLVRQLCLLMKRAGASIDVANHLKQTPLHVAVLVGNDEIAKVLLSEGSSLHLRDKRGNTPLQLAVKFYNSASDKGKKLLNTLLTHPNSKSALNYTDYQGLTIMHDAVSRRNVTAIKLLCQAGADINIADGKSGRTGLASAVLAGDLQMVQLLLQCGACIERQDYGGLSSLDLALQTGNKSLIRILEKKLNKSSSRYLNISDCVSKPPIDEYSRNTTHIDGKKKNTKETAKTKRKSIKKL